MGHAARLCVLGVLILFTFVASAQEIIKQGSEKLSPPRRLDNTKAFKMIMTSGADERAAGEVTRQYQTTEFNGVPAFLLVQNYQMPQGSSSDSSWVSAANLAPIEYRWSMGNESHFISFDDSGASVKMVTPDSIQTIHHPDAASAFNSVTDDLVIGSLPLAVGYKAQIQLYNPPRGTNLVDIEVEAVDRLQTGSGQKSAWRVAYKTTTKSWFWFDTSSRELLRSRTELPNGSEFWRIQAEDIEVWRAAMKGN